MGDDIQQQFVKDMLSESYEGLDRFDAEVLVLEDGGSDSEVMNDIFRVIHTLKGTAGCLGFTRIQNLAHVGENLLDKLRSQALKPNTDIISSLLQLSDALRALLDSIGETGGEGEADNSDLAGKLMLLQEDTAEAAKEALQPVEEVRIEAHPAPLTAEISDEGWGLFDDDLPVQSPVEGHSKGEVSITSQEESAPESPKLKVQPTANGVNASRIAPAASVRVDVGLLDQLMNLVGELVLARNQLMQVSQNLRDDGSAVQRVSQRLNLITSDLQEGIMKTRMQPIGNVWGKFPRIVRDVAHALGKEVRFETFGSETELDRTIIEAIRDPLTHIVRNSIDHGIEDPDTRKAAGKSPEGFLVMRAFHEGGQVNIEVIDDGGGVSVDRVRRKSIERGLIKPDEAAGMSDRELVNLIFTPGFSTSETVSDVSGRGVGMDVVRTNIEKIGGSVDIQSSTGSGTTVKIKIPLTLAIIPALIVNVSDRRFAIPQVNLLELVKLDTARGDKIEEVYGSPVFRLRGKLLPLVFLRDELKIRNEIRTTRNIVVLRADEQEFGLVVDTVSDTEEIVVKPLSRQLKGIGLFAGATIMGDGQVALILDVLGLVEHSGVLDRTQARSGLSDVSDESIRLLSKKQLLLFSAGGRSNLAVNLAQASRLEQFSADEVEHSGQEVAIQYRGSIMPLVKIANLLPGGGGFSMSEGSNSDTISVIVCRSGAKNIGLIVDQIRDIVEDEFEVETGSGSMNTLGTVIVHNRITDLIDLESIIAQLDRGRGLIAS